MSTSQHIKRLSNIEALATALHKEATDLRVKLEGEQSLASSPKSKKKKEVAQVVANRMKTAFKK